MSPATLAERVRLGADEVQAHYRLACQTEAWDDLTVRVAPEAHEVSLHILTEAPPLRSVSGLTVDPGVLKVFVASPPPAPAGTAAPAPESTWEALVRQAGLPVSPPPLGVLRRIPALLRAGGEGLTLVLFRGQPLAIEPTNTRAEVFGMAFDIGTTTVVGHLVDLTDGVVSATVSAPNPQAAFGEDLMSRVAFAQERPEHVRTLQARLLRLVNRLIGEACRTAGVRPERIYKVVVVGNTVMHHTLLGIDPTPVGQAPFAPVVRDGIQAAAQEVGLRVSPLAPVCLLPVVAGFVGADAVAMVLATRLDESPQVRVAADIGTNGEMVIKARDGLFACSVPAGPALEGAHLQCGMLSARGAIDRVIIDRTVHVHVLGGGAPLGLCGSGVLDAVAGLLDAGVLDPSGRLTSDPPADLADDLRRRVVQLRDGSPAFVLVWGPETATGRDVVLTQADIRQVQLAKAAIRSALVVLQRLADTPDEAIAELLLAGALGTYLDVGSALRLGLIPRLPRRRIRYVGNAAALGAQMALISEAERQRAEVLARAIRHVSVAAQPEFQDVFVRAMQFE